MNASISKCQLLTNTPAAKTVKQILARLKMLDDTEARMESITKTLVFVTKSG